MINSKKACLLATLGGVILLPAATLAMEHNTARDVVKDAGGNVVMSNHGTCVVTKWMSNTDECKMGTDVRRLTKEQRTVYFDFNKSTLNSKEKSKLDALSKVIASSKEVASVDIVGHADMIGNDGYNKTLSSRRANTVKSFLAAKGLKTRKIRVEGMGESGSVTNCDSGMERSALISCLAADRRVEIELNFVK